MQGSAIARQEEILDLSLDELMDARITTASRKAETIYDADAAVYVISADDIRRSGVTTIAEALRLVPGVQVARITPHEWAISARGFNGQFANKLLVLMDGRSVYTPLNSGVNWDTVDTLLVDIDRIEVVRGPGGTLWGANAVNGVINVITKSAKETQGLYTEIGGGTFERGFGGVRYGGQIGEVAYRVYGKYFDRESFSAPFSGSDDNDWNMGQGGFRADWNAGWNNDFTVQGDIYHGEKWRQSSRVLYSFPYLEVVPTEDSMTGGNLLGRWTHTYADECQTQVQTYYDRFDRGDQFHGELVQTLDFDLQHRFFLGERHDIVAGLGHRTISTDLEGGPSVTFRNGDRTDHLPSFFLQDQISLLPEKLSLTLGTKVEHHYFTGWNVQPNGRLLWKLAERHSFWSAISKAVRAPSHGEHDIRNEFAFDPTPPVPVVYAAETTGRMKPEEVVAYEIGYRVQAHEKLTVDLATFYNVYDRFQTFEPGTPYFNSGANPPHLVVPFDTANKAYGETYGAELASKFQVSKHLRMDASYSYLQIQLHNRGSLEPSAEFAEHESPHHQVAFRSAFSLPRNVDLDCIVRYVDSLPGFGIPSYITTDVRLGWRMKANMELAIVGQNLLDDRHPEFSNPASLGSARGGAEVPRTFYAKFSWGF